jgi:hypothetical protein
MAKDQIYPEGVRAFSKHPKQPDFVIGSIIITPNDLISWLKKNENLLTEYDGKKQLKLQLLDGKKGLYLSVDTYKKENPESLPF